MPKPEPVATNIICSLCGLQWDRHGEKPTTQDCIKLLKAELASRPQYRSWNQPFPIGWQYDTGNQLSTTTINAPSNIRRSGTVMTDYMTPDEGEDAA